MATGSAPLIDRLFSPFERLAAALSDPERRERAIVGTLVVYTAAWTLFACVSKATQAVHADAAEIAVLSRTLDWGSPKHPTVLSAVAAAWFAIVPQTDLFFHLLAVSMASLAIYVSWHIAGLWLEREKRAAVPFLLMLIPSYNFLCLKFDHNSALTAFWALATYAFLQSFLTRGFFWSVAAGFTGAAALMTKYWSAVLLAGLAMTSLLDSKRAAYFKSPAPWIAAVVAAICITPHLLWLYQNHFVTISHATRTPPAPLSTQALSLLTFIASPIAYLAAPALLLMVFSRPSLAALRDTAMPGSDDRRLAVVAYLAPFVVATVGAALTQVHIGTLWTASMLTLFPVVLLSSPLLEVSRRNVAGFAAAAFAVCLGALAMAPIVALVTLRSGGEYDATHMRGLTAEVESTWRATTNRPVPLVVGPYHHANVVAFYLPDRPRALALFPRLTKELIVDPDMTRDGFVLVCPAHWSDTANWDCTDELAGFLPQSRPTLQRNVILTPGWLGVLGVPRRFSISIFAPRP